MGLPVRRGINLMEIEDIKKIAIYHGWREIPVKALGVISFKRGKQRINVFPRRMIIGTALKHPVKGRTQLFRRYVFSKSLLDKIFTNPRTHTGRGYYIK